MEIFRSLDKSFIKFGKSKIHVIIDDNQEVWYHANDIASAVGYSNQNDAINRHVPKKDKIEQKYIKYGNKKGHPRTLYLNEAGLYRLILRSNMPKAEKFTDWVTHDVLPSIRKYGSYKLINECNNEMTSLRKKINTLIRYNRKIKEEKQKMDKGNAQLKRDLHTETFPNGGVVYVIDYSTDYEEIYRLGMTANMTERKKIYNTHTYHKHPVVIIKDTIYPAKLELCIRAMLYDYRLKKKDFYECKLSEFERAFNSCIKSCKEMEKSKNKLLIGGSKTNNKKQITEYPKIIEKNLIALINDKKLLQNKITQLNKILSKK